MSGFLKKSFGFQYSPSHAWGRYHIAISVIVANPQRLGTAVHLQGGGEREIALLDCLAVEVQVDYLQCRCILGFSFKTFTR